WTKGCVGLHEKLTGCLASTGPARHLSQELKCSFAGAEIWKMKGKVGVDNSYQRDIGKMKTFRDHLCPDQDVDLAAPKGEQRLAISVLASHGVCIHPPHHRVWEKLRDSCFNLLSPEPGIN